ncbi:MAG: molybdenum cofactor guanylyltransferase, partial [Prolixibacteraceae bacterium]|nr:molybdenum cofactor guanylyltransferase [Prolixibacteraceae bacterium]
GIVLSGGKSSRMGSDKGLMLLNGIPLVLRAANLLATIFEEVVISANSPVYEQYNFRVVADEYLQCGPLGGIHAALKTIDTPLAFVLGCDMPLIDRDLIVSILQHRGLAPVTVPFVNGKMEPLCALYSKSLLPEIENRLQTGNFKMQDLILSAGYDLVETGESRGFANVNTPDDYHKI